MNKIIPVLIVVLLLVASCNKPNNNDPGTNKGKKYIDPTLSDTSDTNISISDFDGMHRYVDF